MCGIIGYVGEECATKILFEGLSNLEYRGYDSAGISVYQNDLIYTAKVKGRLQGLMEKVENLNPPIIGTCGIGHTRWATHGEPNESNSHPHNTGRLSLVHNGIIENYLQIKTFLIKEGHLFASETDTEVAARLIDHYYTGNPYTALVQALGQLEGSFAFGVLFADFPGTIYAVRKDSPLIIGLGDGENYIASDVPAILARTRDYYLLDELEIAQVTADNVVIRDMEGNLQIKETLIADWDISAAQKGGYEHFMLKEICEQPKVLIDTISPRIHDGLPDFEGDGLPLYYFNRYKKLHFVACGTAMYAGTVGRYLIEKVARLPVEVDLASEFRYRNPILPPDTLVVAISQSGETADTLAALRLAKATGADTLAIVNVIGSSIAREADHVLYTYAGPEISVASTKAFSVQVAMTYLLAMAFALARGAKTPDETRALVHDFLGAVKTTKQILSYSDTLRHLAPKFHDTNSLFYMGRGLDYTLAMEGSLKLKEISYIHSEAYAAGELKHGTISLITEGVPVVALVTQQELLPKIISNIKEVRSRGGYVFIITKANMEIDEDIYDDIVRLPDVPDLFMPILTALVLQLFAYHVSVVRGCDVDKPRNLAKSVTVE